MLTDEQVVYLRLIGFDAEILKVLEKYQFAPTGTFMLHRMADSLRDWLGENQHVACYDIKPIVGEFLKINVKLLLTAFDTEWLDFDITIK